MLEDQDGSLSNCRNSVNWGDGDGDCQASCCSQLSGGDESRGTKVGEDVIYFLF